jgi:hypothetical protein
VDQKANVFLIASAGFLMALPILPSHAFYPVALKISSSCFLAIPLYQQNAR